MLNVYKKIFLVIFLIIFLIILTIMNFHKTKNSRLIYLSNNYLDASYTSKDYTAMMNIHDDATRQNNQQNITEHFSDANIPTIFDKIDKIYFINLKHRKDRLEQINDEFNKMGVPREKIERIDAVNSKYNGHIGCCKSHIKIMNTILKNKHKYTLVFEDDFVFNVDKQTFNDKLTTFLNDKKDDWDIVQLASVYVKTHDSEKDYKKVKRASTSSAYLINREFVSTLLAELTSSLELMEKDMKKFNQRNNGELKKKFETPYALDQNWYPLQAQSRWYLFKPYLGRQGGKAGGSSILNRKLEGFVNRYKVNKFTLYL